MKNGLSWVETLLSACALNCYSVMSIERAEYNHQTAAFLGKSSTRFYFQEAIYNILKILKNCEVLKIPRDLNL